jgi:L-asparagine permease
MSGVVFAYAAIEMVAVAAGEMQDPRREVPRAVNAVVLRIGVFYVGSILLLVAMLPTSDYQSGTSPFVSVFDRLGFHGIGDVVQAILIVAAMSSLNSGLYSTGRVLRSLGMAKQAPSFTLRMSASGVPYAGILMTAVVYALGAILNAVDPGSAFDVALECASIGVLATWASIFICQIRLRQLSDRGVVPPSTFQAPGSPYTSIVGLVFIALVVLGMAVSGWQEAPDLWHKTDFLVVVLGIPVIAVVLTIGWRVARPKVVANTGDRIGSKWTLDGPRYDETRA